MKRWHEAAVTLVLLAAAAGAVRADDPWDLVTPFDDARTLTRNTLVHGERQRHDVQGTSNDGATPTDQDWYRVQVKAGRSYEARAFSSTFPWHGTFAPTGAWATIAQTNADGSQVLGGVGLPPLDASIDGYFGGVVRWTAPLDEAAFVRVSGPTSNGPTLTLDQNAIYDIVFVDTAYQIPRWNNSSSQVTVLLIQNVSAFLVAGAVRFYDASGALLHTQPLSVPSNGVQVISTGAIPALSGQSGAVVVSQGGAYGALAGKAVALEPATGFTFDTAMTPVPY